MKFFHKMLAYKTKDIFDFIDISDEVIKAVKESGIQNGLVNVQTMHTTASIVVNENEPLLLEDLKEHLEGIASQHNTYRHDDFTVRTVNMCDDECANGHAHCKATHLSANATLNLIGGKLQLGQWQRVLFAELDRSRERKVQIAILGE